MSKNVKKYCAAVFCMLLAVSSVWADLADYPNALGIFGGFTGGSMPYGGLHYQKWFQKFGIQAEGSFFYEKPVLAYYTVSAEALFPVYSNDFSKKLGGRLYLYGSLGNTGETKSLWEEYDYSVDPPVLKQDSIQTFNMKLHTGFGIGIEVVLFQNFSFPFHFGYSADIPLNKIATNEIFVGIMYGAGFRYRF
ncbi:MAG TPA: hypothetical protein PLG87_09295 [Treponemataceae bacterium]|nr:hypothetical protein [Treponemataceae bacterium]